MFRVAVVDKLAATKCKSPCGDFLLSLLIPNPVNPSTPGLATDLSKNPPWLCKEN